MIKQTDDHAGIIAHKTCSEGPIRETPALASLHPRLSRSTAAILHALPTPRSSSPLCARECLEKHLLQRYSLFTIRNLLAPDLAKAKALMETARRLVGGIGVEFASDSFESCRACARK
jgi:hypothetical protein